MLSITARNGIVLPMVNLPTANDVKIAILGWAIAQLKEGEVLASELRFMDGQRRADLAIVSAERLTAIEVKGPRDNLGTLSNQLTDYLNMFLDVYIATSRRYLEEVKKIAPKSVGLIVAHGAQIEVIRSSTPRKSISKQNAARWLIKRDFDNLHSLLSTSRSDDIDTLRAAFSRQLSHSAAQEIVLLKIRDRLMARHDAFISELGQTMTLDDVHMLTIEERIKR